MSTDEDFKVPKAWREQTETDELAEIFIDLIVRTYRRGYRDAKANKTMHHSAKTYAHKPVQEVEAWSRQQTDRVLDKLLEGKTVLYSFNEIPVTAVEASVVAALRVGLEGKQ